jgi:uncharacterized protein involved in type VI secretion and phage assembly
VIVNDENGEARYFGIYDGLVVDNLDPKNRGRVKVKIPGLCEPSTNWALPAGGSHSSGEAGRGGFDPPKIGAAVYVQFLRGDVDAPVYFGGWRGLAGGKSDAPSRVQDASAADAATKLKVYESDVFEAAIDERSGQRVLSLRQKAQKVQVDIYDDRVELKYGGDNGTVLRVKDAKIQLGKSADQRIVKGNAWWDDYDNHLTNLLADLQAMAAAAQGMLAGFQPGIMKAIADIQAFQAQGANYAFLSDLGYVE